ncbi:MAG: hypothetical protein ICV85_08185 [Tolypothrix sp. T3-bin4]|nr:hypothetical protein [Tolypothrix sp. Co-bin9]MBD0302151.1 hypothetical protein [Tolypothrix sp. T3-bin4]
MTQFKIEKVSFLLVPSLKLGAYLALALPPPFQPDTGYAYLDLLVSAHTRPEINFTGF